MCAVMHALASSATRTAPTRPSVRSGVPSNRERASSLEYNVVFLYERCQGTRLIGRGQSRTRQNQVEVLLPPGGKIAHLVIDTEDDAPLLDMSLEKG